MVVIPVFKNVELVLHYVKQFYAAVYQSMVGIGIPKKKNCQYTITDVVAPWNKTINFYGYLKYGDDAKGSVTLNLPPKDLLQLAKFITCDC
jgi:hypothetical protein